MPAISGNTYETRDKIKRVQEQLDQEIKRVAELKQLLSISQAKVTQLEGELAECKAAIAPTPINSCPPEILLMIFKLLMSGGDRIQHIIRLLLVCKRWQGLVLNDPNMWNCIKIVAPEKWDMKSWARSARSYLELCLDLSRASPLDIELNFSTLRTTRQQLIDRLHIGFFHLSSEDQVGEEFDLLDEWLDTLDYDDLESDLCVTNQDCLPTHAIDLIKVLAGIDREAIPRWERLAISFPSSGRLAEEIWQEVAPFTSNLSYLDLLDVNWEDMFDFDEDEEDDSSLIIPKWNISQIKTLEINTLIGWDRFLSFDPSSLRGLTVEISVKEEFFSQIARFCQLETLTLASPVFFTDPPLDPAVKRHISLPVLEELVIISEYGGPATVTWELPSLKRLHVKVGWRLPVNPSMPRVQPSEVHWEAESGTYFHQDLLKMADKIIRDFLLCYTSAERFSVTSFLKEKTLKVLKELSKEGVLPLGWKTVSFHDASSNVETMQVDGIVGS